MSLLIHLLTIFAAPSQKPRTSKPDKPRGKSPTADKTEYLPPTFSGTSIISKPLSRPPAQRFESLLVVRTILSFIFSPKRFLRHAYITSKLATVSVVSPDLLITLTRISSGLFT